MAALVATALTGAGFRPGIHSAPAPTSLTEGIAADPCGSQRVIAVPPDQNASYDAGNSVQLAGQCGTGTGAGKQWLAAGTVPGTGPVLRSMADRSLLDLYLSVQPDGAVVAGY